MKGPLSSLSPQSAPPIWRPGLFCFLPHLLIPGLPTQVSLSLFSHLPNQTPGPSFSPPLLTLLPSQTSSPDPVGSFEDAKIMLPLELQALGLGNELLVLERAIAFDLLGIQKWGLWKRDP